MKNITQICQEVTRREGGKKSLSIAQIREVVSIISDLVYLNPRGDKVIKILVDNGKRRFIKRMRGSSEK